MPSTHALDSYHKPAAYEIAPLARVRDGVLAVLPGRPGWPALVPGQAVAVALWTPAAGAVSSFAISFATVVRIEGPRLLVAPSPPEGAYALAVATFARGMDS